MKRFRFRAVVAVVTAVLSVGCGGSGTTPAAPSPAPTNPPPIRAIVVLGDSLAVSPSPEQSFPARLEARVAESGLRWTLRNAGVSADTTADGVRRLEPVLTADVGLLIVELGANDGLRGVDVATVERNLSAIVSAAKARGLRVLLCGMETPPNHGLDYSVAFHFVFPRVAQQQAVPLVPFLLAGVALDPELNGTDGVHPNAVGAQRIADTVWPYLEPLLRAE
jgi:acyl-CoA thioesterase I